MSRGAHLRQLLLVAASTVLLGGCATGPVTIDAPQGAEKVRPACERFLDAAPDRLADQPRREVEPDDALGLAWGKPAITVTCGVDAPAGPLDVEKCRDVGGIDWLDRTEDAEDPENEDAEAVFTTVGRVPRVQVVVPGEFDAETATAALTELAPAATARLKATTGCS